MYSREGGYQKCSIKLGPGGVTGVDYFTTPDDWYPVILLSWLSCPALYDSRSLTHQTGSENC